MPPTVTLLLPSPDLSVPEAVVEIIQHMFVPIFPASQQRIWRFQAGDLQGLGLCVVGVHAEDLGCV